MIQAGFGAPLGANFMMPPQVHSNMEGDNDLAVWNRQYSGRYEMGGVLTMIAGLLNLLAIFDAAAGPIVATVAPDEAADPKKKPSGKSASGARA
jgi:hypothetical protein